jgi:hypothetical protein
MRGVAGMKKSGSQKSNGSPTTWDIRISCTWFDRFENFWKD